ncbi:MAG: cbb3-type cytochrome c oxidase subunit I, partial [Planctomycetota bacterium]
MESVATGQPAASQPQLEPFSYDDAVVRKFLFAMIGWALVSFLVGIILAIQLPFPTIPFTKIPTNFGLEWFTFGRLRPLHTNAAIFAFAGNAIFAGVYYSTQRLCKARMWSDTLSNLNFWGWQLVILCAAITLPMGVT